MRVLSVLGVIGVLTAVNSTSAVAASGWSIEHSANVEQPQGLLAGVSCPSAGFCTAVGRYTDRAGVARTLAAARTGTSWSRVVTPNPDKAVESRLSAVWCGSASACIAVGDSTTASGTQQPLAEEWSGTSWSILATAIPTGALATVMSSVWCSSPTACTAVGYDYDLLGRHTLAERWNGSTWTVQTTPDPLRLQDTELHGVSCASTTACIAVGSGISSGQEHAFAERWNGASWKAIAFSLPSGATQSNAFGVACSAADACTAVGVYFTTNGLGISLAERWDGTSWAAQTMPTALDSYLTAVSCPSATSCTAVGRYASTSYSTLAEAWDGTSWQIQPTPNVGGIGGSFLDGVSCGSSAGCSAVGYGAQSSNINVSLAEAWNGMAWSIEPTHDPVGAPGNLLSGVSCAVASACTAVGVSETGGGDNATINRTLAEAWNGTAWSIQATPVPAGSSASELTGVSCAAANACSAVGNSFDRQANSTSLAESWDGTAWSIEQTPIPTNSLDTALSGVSCTSGSACTAVGHFFSNRGSVHTLAERWDGTAWVVQTTPNLFAVESAFDSVACSSATRCVAVGYSGNGQSSDLALAGHWNGTHWRYDATPNPAGATRSALHGVACPSPSACVAVGDYRDSAGAQFTLAQAWNGTVWSLQASPVPSGATYTSLTSVACSSTTACTAVGQYTNSTGTVVPFAEVWDGSTWSIQAMPSPRGALYSALAGVACTALTACVGVGAYFTPSSVYLNLTEREGP